MEVLYQHTAYGQVSSVTAMVSVAEANQPVMAALLPVHFEGVAGRGSVAETGASLRDLMARMGHDSMQAALIYQHRTRGADQKIADGLERCCRRTLLHVGCTTGLLLMSVRPGAGKAQAVRPGL